MSSGSERVGSGILTVYNTGSDQVYFDLADGRDVFKAGVFVAPNLVADFTPLDLRNVRRPLLGLEVIKASEHVLPVIDLASFSTDERIPGIALPEPANPESGISVKQVLSRLRGMAGILRLRPEDTKLTGVEQDKIITARVPSARVLQVAERIILAPNGEERITRLGRMVLEDLMARVESEGGIPLAPIMPPTYNAASASGQTRPARPQTS